MEGKKKQEQQQNPAPSRWISGIQEILAQYNSKADLEVFRAARELLEYQESIRVPTATFTHIATIIAYCENEIRDNLDAKLCKKVRS